MTNMKIKKFLRKMLVIFLLLMAVEFMGALIEGRMAPVPAVVGWLGCCLAASWGVHR